MTIKLNVLLPTSSLAKTRGGSIIKPCAHPVFNQSCNAEHSSKNALFSSNLKSLVIRVIHEIF